MKFEDLGLAEPLVRGVREQGYHTVTPIQVTGHSEGIAGA